MSANAMLLTTLAVGVSLQSVPATAEESPASGGQQQAQQQAEFTLESVIVTARKREESILNVPVVMNVLTQESLERTKTDDLYAVATRVPGILLGNAVNSSGTQVSLRGVGTTTLNATMDQSVSLNIDGLPLSQGVAYGAGMFDVSQIEVLKGPQALFFGKNSPAGVISLRSVDPGDEFEIVARGGYELEAEEKEVDFIVSGPLSDSLKLRLATRYSDQEGFFRNAAEVIPGTGARNPSFRNYAPTEDLILRGTALFEPGNGYTARLKLTYSDHQMDGGASPLQLVYCPDGTGAVPPTGIAFIAGDNCKADDTLRLPWMDPAAFPGGLPNAGKPFEDSTQTFGSLEQNIALSDGLDLTSVTGYYENDYETLHAGSTTGTTVPIGNNITFENRQFTQELRLTSDFVDSPVNFMVGGFYQSGDQYNEVRIVSNTLLGLPPLLQHVIHEIDISSLSFFGQVMWDVTDKLELAAGARWTDEERKHKEINRNPVQGELGPVARPDPKIDSSNVSPEVTLTYKATEDFTAFASYKTGYKSGSFSSQNFIPSTQRASFNDEEVRGGEVGIKTLLADRQVVANLAAYYYDYTDLQVGALELSQLPGGQFIFVSRTINAASAEVRGVDFDVTYSPHAIDGLSLNAALNYNRARYDSFPNAPCGNGQTISQGCDQLFNPTTGRYLAQDLSGRRLVRAPDWSSFVGFDYQMAVGGDRTLAFGAGANYTSEYSTTLVDLPGYEQDAFVKFDASVALRGADDAWEVALIGRNLGNELTRGWCVNSNVQNGTVFGNQISGAATGGPAGQDEAACYIERGREVWARLSVKF